MVTLKQIQKEVEQRYFEKRDSVFVAMCLAGEVGEVCNWIKKFCRVENGSMVDGKTREQIREEIKKELPDIIFYVAKLANDGGYDLEILWKEKMEINDKKYGDTIGRRR